MVLTSRSHTSPDAGRSLNSGVINTLDLDFLDPQHKEDFLEEPKPQVLDGPGPFWEESSLAPKAGSFTAPLDLDPFSLKNLISTLHEPTLGPCLDLENDRYEKSPPPSILSIFGQNPLLEEFVCYGGSGLPETEELSQFLAILSVETDL